MNFSEFLRRILTRPSIGHRLAIYILMFSSVVTILFTLLQLSLDYFQGVHVIEVQIAQIKKSYSPSLANSLWVISKRDLKLQLDGISRLPDIQYLEVRSDTDEVLVSVGKSASRHIIVHDHPLYYSYRGKENFLGKLHIEATLSGLYQRLKDKVVVILITQGIKTFLVSFFILLLFQQFVGRHLIRIARHAETLETDSATPVLTLERDAAPDTAMDELDVLVKGINDKNCRLERAYQDLVRSERATRLREENMAITLNSIGDAVIVTDAAGHVTRMNPVAERLTG